MNGPTDLCGDNLGMIISRTNPDFNLRKKHVAVSYYKLQESAATGIVKPIKVYTAFRRYNILKKKYVGGHAR